MSWNHRVLVHEKNGQIYFKIHEVYYDKNGVPDGYSESSVAVFGDDLKELDWVLNRIKECRKKPVLWAEPHFPKPAIIHYKCIKCGRSDFTKKTPHLCNNSFRKRNIEWETLASYPIIRNHNITE